MLVCWMPAPAVAASAHCQPVRGAPAAADWGINGAEQMAAGFRSAYENTPMAVEGLQGARQIKSGFKFSLAVMGNCTVQAWGINSKAELGDGTQQTRNHPVAVVGLSEVKEVAIGNAHAMALLYDGTVWTWGASEFGERGNHEKGFERVARDTEPQWFVPRDRPTKVPGLSGVEQIAAGGTRDFALTSGGEVVAWGDDRGGDLGVQVTGEGEKCLGETHAITPIPCSTIPRPVMVSPGVPLSGVERIGAGTESAYAVRAGGEEVLDWGENAGGQLGNGTTTPSPSPVRALMEPGSPVVEIAGGSMHTLARLASGQVYAWGADGAGQLGFTAGREAWERCGEELACSTIPQQVYALAHVVAIAPAENASLVLEEQANATRVIYVFGATGHDELFGLGNVPYEQTATPTPITSLPPVRALSASLTTAAALLESAPGPPPVLTATPQQQGLEVAWNVPTSTYRLRYRPVGTREFSSPEVATCHSPCSVQLTGLRPEPYEVTLKTPEGREGREKIRKVIGTPLPAAGAPVNTSPPTITGSPATETGRLREGQTLSVEPGTWTNHPTSFSYLWLRCLGLGENGVNEEEGSECEPITSGAQETPVTTSTYRPGPADVGRTIAVEVRATNAQGFSVANSEAELILQEGEESEPPPPQFITAPTLTGVAVEGHQLTAHRGTWENEPIGYEEKWFRCKGRNPEGTGGACKAINRKNPVTGKSEPATGNTYVTSAEDAGLWIEDQETAENTGGWNVATSLAVQIASPAPPTNVAPPTITGIAQRGQTLKVQPGTWNNAPQAPRWQWLRCTTAHNCKEIKAATGATYTIGSEDVHDTLKVSETVENGAGRSKAATSSATQAVPVPASSPPSMQGAPRITGSLIQGQTLTAVPGSWSNQPFTFARQWLRCEPSGQGCQTIAGATGLSYLLSGHDVGHTLVLRETATNAAGSTAGSSKASGLVAGAVPVGTLPPTINGRVQQGQTLSAQHGSWSNEPTGYTYQWRRCNSAGRKCKAIAGAVARTYTPTAADVGSTLEVQEAAFNATGSGKAVGSALTAAVLQGAPQSLMAPRILGMPRVGQMLTAVAGQWANGTSELLVTWMRCEAGECHPIEGATQRTYKLVPADAGLEVAVREAAVNAGGWSAAVSEAVQIEGSSEALGADHEPFALQPLG
jgi:alpha-tubulin suppressor-like RCC1 family protein